MVRACKTVAPPPASMPLPAVNRKADVAFFGMYRVMLPAYGAGPYLPAIVLERPVYVREMADGLYSPLAYLLYKVRPAAMLNQLLPGYTQELVALEDGGSHQCYMAQRLSPGCVADD